MVSHVDSELNMAKLKENGNQIDTDVEQSVFTKRYEVSGCGPCCTFSPPQALVVHACLLQELLTTDDVERESCCLYNGDRYCIKGSVQRLSPPYS